MYENYKKKHGQWVVHTKGFDPASGPSTLPFEEEEEIKDEPEVPTSAFDISDSCAPHLSRERPTVSEEQYNILHDRIDSLTLTVSSLGSLFLQIQAQQMDILDRQAAMQAWQDASYVDFYACFHPPPPPPKP